MRYIEEIELDMRIQLEKIEKTILHASAFIRAVHELFERDDIEKILKRQGEIMEQQERDRA